MTISNIGLGVFPSPGNPLVERFAWKSMDFEFGEEWVKEAARSQKVFVPENNLPVGIEPWQEKLFITVPRWREG